MTTMDNGCICTVLIFSQLDMHRVATTANIQEPKEIKYLSKEKLSDLDLNVNEIEPLIDFLVENVIYLWNYEFVEANSELFPEFMKITGGIACFQCYPDIYWI